jgi:hypothetical protein
VGRCEPAHCVVRAAERGPQCEYLCHPERTNARFSQHIRRCVAENALGCRRVGHSFGLATRCSSWQWPQPWAGTPFSPGPGLFTTFRSVAARPYASLLPLKYILFLNLRCRVCVTRPDFPLLGPLGVDCRDGCRIHTSRQPGLSDP